MPFLVSASLFSNALIRLNMSPIIDFEFAGWSRFEPVAVEWRAGRMLDRSWLLGPTDCLARRVCALGLDTMLLDVGSSIEARVSFESLRMWLEWAARLVLNAFALLDVVDGSGTLAVGGESFALPLEAALVGLCRTNKSLNCSSSIELLPLDDEGSAGVFVRVPGRLMVSDSRSTASSSLASGREEMRSH